MSARAALHYYTAPLSLLHTGTSVLGVLNAALACGIVNTGLGYRKTHGGAHFDTVLETGLRHAESQGQRTVCPAGVDRPLWEATLAGAGVLGIRGGDLLWDLRAYEQHRQPRQVLFRMRSDWFWNAIYHARNLAGDRSVPYDKPFPWREFRLIAALLSARVNHHGFAFLGWESIQARACGYHTKALLQAARAAGTLPAHCQPLSRDMIRHDLDKLEALGFFARCRYSRGPRGGFMAYSFRHPQRQDLITAVQAWAAANARFKAKTARHRQEDLQAFRKTLAAKAEPRC